MPVQVVVADNCNTGCTIVMERVVRLELTKNAWKALMLPLHHTRIWWNSRELNSIFKVSVCWFNPK